MVRSHVSGRDARRFQSAIGRLQEHVPGLRVIEEPSANESGLLVGGGNRWRTRVEALSVVRHAVLEGRLAANVLRLRAEARAGEKGLVVITLPRLGRRTVQAVTAFMATYASDVAWALVGEDGAVAARLPDAALEIEHHRRVRARRAPKRRSVRLFSDLNRWMLKVLLLRNAPEGMWGGPRQPAASQSELQRIAHVSPGTAHRFVKTLEEQDFLRVTSEGLEIIRRRQLLEVWLRQEQAERRPVVPARSLFGDGLDWSALMNARPADIRVAVGGFDACKAVGVLHTVADLPFVHIAGDLELLLDAWDLEPCEERDAGLRLVVSRYPESVFRGTIAPHGVPTVDILQAALDVIDVPGRGPEQVEYILDHVLGWET